MTYIDIYIWKHLIGLNITNHPFLSAKCWEQSFKHLWSLRGSGLISLWLLLVGGAMCPYNHLEKWWSWSMGRMTSHIWNGKSWSSSIGIMIPNRNIKFVSKHQPAICLLVFHLIQAMKFYDILLFIAFSCIFFINFLKAVDFWVCQVLLAWSIPLFLASAGPAAACPSAAARLPRSVSCVSPAQLRTPA